MRVATNRAGILLAIMRPGQLKKVKIKFEAVFQSAYFFINKFIINYDLNFYSLTFWSSNGQFHQIELEKSAIAKRWQIVELLNDSLWNGGKFSSRKSIGSTFDKVADNCSTYWQQRKVLSEEPF